MFSYLQQALAVQKASRKGVLSQLAEMVSLRLFHNKIGPSEYYQYKIYDPAHSTAQQREFVGWRRSAQIDKLLNDDRWRIFANDKVIFYSMMEANGLRYPQVVALFDLRKRNLKNCTLLHSLDAAGAYLRDSSNYPLFIKPVSGTYGRGAFSAVGYDSQTDAVKLGNGELKQVSEIVKMFQFPWAQGYVLQKLLQPHKDVAEIVGPRLSSLRVIVVLQKDGPKVFRAVWKLPTGNNMSDNFMHGETGNLIGNVDLESGKIKFAVTGVGANIRKVDTHPNTGKSLTDIPVPLWNEVKQYVTAGALLFPGLKMQHWDIALCPEGPIALEVNVEGSMDLHQIASNKGVQDNVMRELLLAE